MADHAHPRVAGEPLQVLEGAIACLEYEVEECGCIRITGTLPDLLGAALDRALLTIELEMVGGGIEPYSGPGTNPLDELMVRVVEAREP